MMAQKYGLGISVIILSLNHGLSVPVNRMTEES